MLYQTIEPKAEGLLALLSGVKTLAATNGLPYALPMTTEAPALPLSKSTTAC
jgi:hypothetical protein